MCLNSIGSVELVDGELKLNSEFFGISPTMILALLKAERMVSSRIKSGFSKRAL